jgi:hypothetical protein
MSQIASNVVAIEATQVGVKEATGNNDGLMVSRYQAVVGLGQGDAWCAAFQMWALEKAGVKGWPVSGYVPTVWDWCEGHGVLKPQPRVGAWVMYQDNGSPSMYHIGIVEKVHANGTFDAIEGNEADMVKRTFNNPVPGSKADRTACKFGYWDDVCTWDGSTPSLPALVKKVKLFVHNGKAGLVVVRDVSLKGATLNGKKATAAELEAAGIHELILDYQDYAPAP